jgi:hypothetical protein
MQSLGYMARHRRSVPRFLSDDQNAQRVEQSHLFLRVLEAQQSRAWHNIVTLVESWFYFIALNEFR